MNVSYFGKDLKVAAVLVTALVAIISVACGSESGNVEQTEVLPVDTETPAPPVVPAFNSENFAEINPEPAIRKLDYSIDLGFNYLDPERDRIPRDAIRPVYSPEFHSAELAELDQQELVMGVEINGEARAYPVGMLRIREMVNDEIGGIPVLVTW